MIVYFPDTKEEINSKISFAGRVIDPLNRTFTVEAAIKSDMKYHPNMIAVMKINDYKNDTVVAVPINAVQHSEEGDYVLLAKEEGGKSFAKKQFITLGQSYNGMAEVKSGLNKGDRLITTGFQELNDGELVKL